MFDLSLRMIDVKKKIEFYMVNRFGLSFLTLFLAWVCVDTSVANKSKRPFCVVHY